MKTAKFTAQFRAQKDYAHLREKTASEKPSDLFKVALKSVEASGTILCAQVAVWCSFQTTQPPGMTLAA